MTSDRAQLSCTPTRILLAEDDGELRMLLALRLRGTGFDVTEACDGQDLLERLLEGPSSEGGSDPFDLVLSDLNMPPFNALDVMIGAHSHLKTTPVVLMTSFADAHTREQARRLGVTEVLDKPLRLDDLSATLGRILRHARRPVDQLHQ